MTVTKSGKTFEVVELKKDPSAIEWGEGYPEILQGKSLEEQMDYFRVSYNGTYSWSSYGQVDFEQLRKYSHAIEEDEYVTALVVYDGLLVGVVMKETQVLPNQGILTYYGCDNNGAGYKEYEEWGYFYCCPKEEK